LRNKGNKSNRIEYKKHICKTCKDPFYTNAELLSHRKKKKKCLLRDKSFKVLNDCVCTACGTFLSTPGKLKVHMARCTTTECIKNDDTNISNKSMFDAKYFQNSETKPLNRPSCTVNDTLPNHVSIHVTNYMLGSNPVADPSNIAKELWNCVNNKLSPKKNN